MGSFSWGGSEELWATLADEALRDGHDVIIATYRWPTLPARIVDLQNKGARVVLRDLSRRQYRRRERIVRRLKPPLAPFEQVTTFRPDVYCISQGGTYDIADLPELRHAVAASPAPYVVVCQFNRDTEIVDDGTREVVADFFADAYRVAFVAGGNAVATRRQLARDLPNAIIVRNPVNLTDPAALPWPSERPVSFASVARLEALYKGQDILCEALAAPAWRDRPWRLRLYGEGPNRRYLDQLARFYGLADRVEFVGHVTDIKAVWSHNHLAVLPSRAEGTPLALIEAMLCGRPSVVTDVGGNAEWVREGETGFVAEAPTARSFGATLERAWAARDDWARIGLRAHYSAAGKYDLRPGRALFDILVEAVSART